MRGSSSFLFDSTVFYLFSIFLIFLFFFFSMADPWKPAFVTCRARSSVVWALPLRARITGIAEIHSGLPPDRDALF